MIDYKIAYEQLLKENSELKERLLSKEDVDLIHTRVLESSARSVAVINLNREILWINTTAVKMYGFEIEEVIGKRIADLIFGEETDTSVIPELFTKVLLGESVTFDHVAYHKSKQKMWIRAELRPFYNLDNIIDRVIVYGLDVSEEKKVKLELQQEQAKRDLLLKHTNYIVYKRNLKGEITEVNEAWTRYTGYTAAETLFNTNLNVIHPDDVEITLKHRQALLSGEEAFNNFDVRIIAKNGNVVFLNITSSPVFSAEGKIVGLMGIAKEVTQQVKNLHLLQMLTHYSRGMISLNDEHTNYVYLSPSCKKITGWEAEELIGKSSFDYYHPDDVDNVTRYREALIKDNVADGESCQVRYKKKDGTYTWVELIATWFRDPYENAMRTVLHAQPIDKKKIEEKKVLEQLEMEKKLNKLKSSFLSFVSHEFKTPLSIIKALAEITKMNIEDDRLDVNTLIEDLDTIDYEVNSLTTLIEDILVHQELESGKLQLNFSPQNIESIIINANIKLNIKKDKRESALINTIGKPYKVLGDAKYLEMIFKNLLSNAYKYSAGRPTPIVNINFFDNQCVVCVKDFGIGIPEADQKKLFDNFFRASNVGSLEGTGLGLNIVNKFVTMHNGNIVCVSKENEGTEMYVSLPIIVPNGNKDIR